MISVGFGSTNYLTKVTVGWLWLAICPQMTLSYSSTRSAQSRLIIISIGPVDRSKRLRAIAELLI